MATHENGHVEGNHLLFRPERFRWYHFLSLLILRRNLGVYNFVESSEGVRVRADWVTVLTLALQKILLTMEIPLMILGRVTEFILNLVALNGGILCLLWHFITGSVVFPKRKAANYRSITGHIDGRLYLYKPKSLITYFSLMDPGTNLGDINPLDLSVMASKVAYENAAYIANAVTNHWKMNFVGFYNCWNKYLNDYTTQAYIFTDKPTDAKLIVVAFRGTEPFNARDWSTDVDLSWLRAGPLTGNIHIGFLKALGLQDEKDFNKGFPKDFKSDKPVAYYTIRETLNSLLKDHQNAKVLVTGHSLGAAMAAIFPVILSIHEEKGILSAMYAVMNYGQPRVGDAILGAYVEKTVRVKCYRMIYRYDVVPRVPFNFPPLALFKHFGTCIYFDEWKKGQVVEEFPNPNYFDPMYQPSMYFNAWRDLIKALFIGWTQGKEYKESTVSILYRAIGLVIPGIASHSPRDYVNAARLAEISNKIMV